MKSGCQSSSSITFGFSAVGWTGFSSQASSTNSVRLKVVSRMQRCVFTGDLIFRLEKLENLRVVVGVLGALVPQHVPEGGFHFSRPPT